MNKNKVDVAQIFLVYMALVGDAEKTALALDINVADVADLAEKEGWPEKIARVSILTKAGNEGDWERAQNRALNFVQCHQLRRAIDDMIVFIGKQKPEDIIFQTDKHGTARPTARVFSDLTAAMERIHMMTYAALGDSVKEREARKETQDPTSSNSAGLHAALISALNKAKLTGKASDLLIGDAVAKVEQLKPAILAQPDPAIPA